MYFTEFLASCRRRWWLALLVVAGTVAMSVLAFRAIPPDYDAEASVVLIPPTTSEDPEANRYLQLGSLSSSVDVLARSMVSADTANRLEEEVPGVEYDVTTDFSTSAPILLVSTTSTDRVASDRMLAVLLTEIPETLDRLQDEIDVEPQNRITTQVVSAEPEPEVNNKSRVRKIGVVGAGLLFASGVLLSVVDGLLIRRSRRRARPATAPSAAAGVSDRPRAPSGKAPASRPRKTRTSAPGPRSSGKGETTTPRASPPARGVGGSGRGPAPKGGAGPSVGKKGLTGRQRDRTR